jgi:hypothetical protein
VFDESLPVDGAELVQPNGRTDFQAVAAGRFDYDFHGIGDRRDFGSYGCHNSQRTKPVANVVLDDQSGTGLFDLVANGGVEGYEIDFSPPDVG